jgi:glycosyltransferase Alg8
MQHTHNQNSLEGTAGFAVFTLVLGGAFLALPPVVYDPESELFLLSIGTLALWRYSWAGLNFLRSVIYRRVVFPGWRDIADENTESLMPSKIYLLITGFRIEADTISRTARAAISEAANCGVPVTIVASIVELGDEFLFRTVFESLNPPPHIDIRIVRISGTGKRDGLAQGFRAISRDIPPQDAIVAVIDGDSVLEPGVIRKCAPFFKLRPNLGALTTDEVCEVKGSFLMQKWHDLRFAQRHILMSSLSLSKRLMTLTGRMSMFRAGIITNPDFINHMTGDYLDHWRLGRFRFLTGDDKSSLYWALARGYEQIYVPDAVVTTLEEPPSKNFIPASTRLMLRWFGNMLRTNARVLKLGPERMPLFVWWAFVDQRLSMWTTLAGPVFAGMLTTIYGPIIIAYYFVWVAFIRWIMTLMVWTARPKVSWLYPFLLYYNQIYGSLIKTWVLFRLDRQSWTRQKTRMERGLSLPESLWNSFSSHALHATAIVLFVCVIGLATGALEVPDTPWRYYFGG